MRFYLNKVVFDADDEEPDCMRCDRVEASCDTCCNHCGAEHGWALYERTSVRTYIEEARRKELEKEAQERYSFM